MKNNDINIIIPAYNESENILEQVNAIRKSIPNVHIVIVDDSNKKENERTIKAIGKINNIKMISRGKKIGRGSAVIDGFKFASKDKKVKYFFEVDADLAHDVTQLNRFLDKIKETKASMVIGSRYAKGGMVVGIPIYRRILSKMINLFLSFMLNIKLSDYTSGYRLYKRDAVLFLINTEIKSAGFITLSEITYKLNKNGFKIAEVPATILKRKYGKSTMGIKELMVSLFFILRMKFDEEILTNIKKR